MFSKFFIVVPFVLGLSLQAAAHAIISPALGVTGTPVRNDVQRPSTAKPCGTVDIASTLNTVTPVVAAADGSFSTNITNFNGGQDGSTQVTAQVDATGAGTSFVDATVTKNGVLAPTTVGSTELTVQLPAGAQCAGGTSGDLCLVSFVTAGGFGNCIAVQQDAAATATNATSTDAAAASAAAASAVASSAASANGTTTTTGKKHHHQKKPAAAQNAARTWGSRRARMARLFYEEEEAM